MSEPRRWTIHLTAAGSALSSLGVDEQEVLVMPVSEHERWRDAFLEGQKADHAKHRALREAAQTVVDAKATVMEARGSGLGTAVALDALVDHIDALQVTLDLAANRGEQR